MHNPVENVVQSNVSHERSIGSGDVLAATQEAIQLKPACTVSLLHKTKQRTAKKGAHGSAFVEARRRNFVKLEHSAMHEMDSNTHNSPYSICNPHIFTRTRKGKDNDNIANMYLLCPNGMYWGPLQTLNNK